MISTVNLSMYEYKKNKNDLPSVLIQQREKKNFTKSI